MDYRVYHLSRKEVCKSITLAGLLTAEENTELLRLLNKLRDALK